MMLHLAASTVSASAAMMAAWALRRGPARWRFALLLAAILRFAIPTAWLASAGGSLAPVFPAPARAPRAVEDLRHLLLHPGLLGGIATPVGAAHTGGSAASLALLFWAAGAAACYWLWARQWNVRLAAVRPANEAESESLRRACRALGIARGVELRIVDGERVPGALGFGHPVVVLPDGLAAQLSEPELDGVLAHELAHILRRDNLWAALAHAIVVVFWFHPLVWWIERWMLKERETACDELVLERGTHPEVYLSGILKVCRMAFGGAEGYAGANGSDLEIRMERIMSPNVRRASYSLRALAAGLVTMAALFPLAAGYLKAQPQTAGASSSESESLFKQGANLMGQKDYQGAETAFRRASEADPRNTKALTAIAEVYVAQGRMDEAVSFMQKEAADKPNSQSVQMALGNIEVRAGKYDLAISQYEKILSSMNKDSSQRSDIYLRLGEVYRRMKDYPAAIAALRQAAEIKPDSNVAIVTLALVLDQAGQQQAAQDAYRKVLEREPENAVTLNNLAFLMASHGGDLDQALDYAQRARREFPDMVEVLDTLGYIYLARKSSDEAFGAFREAVLKNPASPAFRSHLLLAIEQKGDRSSTAEALKVALRDEPTEANQDLVKKLLQ
jgi:tetratricopeptide (TPR) repeat protein/Zn-dependent protease with chaperone function